MQTISGQQPCIRWNRRDFVSCQNVSNNAVFLVCAALNTLYLILAQEFKAANSSCC